MIVKHISLPSIEIVDQLTPTERGSKGFSSTDKASDQLQHPSPPIEAFNISDRHAAATATASVSTPHAFLHFSDDPFDNQITINIEKRGRHPTLKLDLEMCTDRQQPRLISCCKGEPAGKIKKWRSTLRGAYILAVDGDEIRTIPDIKNKIMHSTNSDIFITF